MKASVVSARIITIVALALGILLAAKAPSLLARSGQSSTPKQHKGVYAALAEAPLNARRKRNPFEKRPDAMAAGKTLFEEHCAQCHSSSADGGTRGPSLRAAAIRQATPGALFWILSNGVVRHGMPDWSKLPGPERWQIVTFLESLNRSSRPTPRRQAK